MEQVELGGVSGGDQCERRAVLHDGTEVFCAKSFGHDTVYRPGDVRRMHFDVAEERGWHSGEEREVVST